MDVEHIIDAEFELSSETIYLNHAAMAVWPVRTGCAVARFCRENVSHGGQNYPRWSKVEERLRRDLAALVNAQGPQDIALTRSTSEALSVVAHGLSWQQGDNVVIAEQEFPSNRIVWESLAGQGVTVREATLYGDDPEGALLALINDNTRLLSVSAVQYNTGLKLDLASLGSACRRKNVLFCVDAIQAVGAVEIDVQAAHIDFLMANGHKWMLGPEGVGIFYSHPGAREHLALHQFGWHMVADLSNFEDREWAPAAEARRFECGSPNMLGIHALAASVSLLLDVGMPCIASRVYANSQALSEMISRSQRLVLLSSTEETRQSGIVVFQHRQMSSDDLLRYLRTKGVVCAGRGEGIRFSPHFYTSRAAIEQAVEWSDNAFASSSN